MGWWKRSGKGLNGQSVICFVRALYTYFCTIQKHIFVYIRIWRKKSEKYKSCGFCCRDYPLTWNSHHPSNKLLPIQSNILQTAHARRRVGPWLPQLQFVIICGIRDSGRSLLRQLEIPMTESHGTMVYLPTWMVGFLWLYVGKYTMHTWMGHGIWVVVSNMS